MKSVGAHLFAEPGYISYDPIITFFIMTFSWHFPSGLMYVINSPQVLIPSKLYKYHDYSMENIIFCYTDFDLHSTSLFQMYYVCVSKCNSSLSPHFPSHPYRSPSPSVCILACLIQHYHLAQGESCSAMALAWCLPFGKEWLNMLQVYTWKKKTAIENINIFSEIWQIP